jgi:iodotyrosine deiodinase
MIDHDRILLPDYLEYSPVEMQRRATVFCADLKRRHTVRDFSGRPVPRALIETCIRAAGSAPSGANHQPWSFR